MLTEVERNDALSAAVEKILAMPVIVGRFASRPIFLSTAVAEAIVNLARETGDGYVYEHRFVLATDSGRKLRDPMCADCANPKSAHLVLD